MHAVATIGKIIADQKLEDGRYNLLLRGLSRLRISEEITCSKPYRKARGKLLVETALTSVSRERRLRKQLVAAAQASFEGSAAVKEEFRKLLANELPLGALADLIAFALPLEVDFKQALLEELDVVTRATRLLGRIAKTKMPVTEGLPFPPEFSVN